MRKENIDAFDINLLYRKVEETATSTTTKKRHFDKGCCAALSNAVKYVFLGQKWGKLIVIVIFFIL